MSKDRTATMTAANAPSPNVVTASSEWGAGGYPGWGCFDKGGVRWSTALGVFAATLIYDFGSALWAADGYTITGGLWNAANYPPKNWTFEGSNTGTFAGEETTLDTQNNITGWDVQQTKSFSFTNIIKYRYYRWNISTNGAGSGQINVEEMTINAPDEGGSFLLNFV